MLPNTAFSEHGYVLPSKMMLAIFLGAPDWWDSPRKKELILVSNIFRQISFIPSRPPAGNAERWAFSL